MNLIRLPGFIIVSMVSILGIFTMHAQTRSRTRAPVPTGANSISWITNIPYVTGGALDQQLDLYIPTNLKGEPLIVFVHGGGWRHGDKAGDSLNPNNLQLLWGGYAMASINYRLTPDSLWPAQIEDCKAAIRWLKAHAADYGYDPNRIGVIGESAGGHLVAMLGTTSGKKLFEVGENLSYSSDVNCVVNLFGVDDFSRTPSAAGTLLGAENKSDPELIRSVSPVSYVHKEEPPMLIVHGTDDKLVPYEQAQILVTAMDKVKARYHFHTVVGGGHNPYFGLSINEETRNFDAGGGGIGIFEDRDVEPLIAAYFRHYLLDKRSDGFWGLPTEKPSPSN
jgi:acetyl esterase/lipase